MRHKFLFFLALMFCFSGGMRAQTTIAVQDFDATAPVWGYSNDITFFDNGWGGDGYYGIIDIANASPLSYASFSGNIMGENDLDDEGDNGTTGFATLTFDAVDVSGQSDVVITFDYEIQGYNANDDDAKYEVFFDGTGQGEVFLLDGNDEPEEASGTALITVPDDVNQVSLEIAVRNNGGSGYSGFDNIKVLADYVNPYPYHTITIDGVQDAWYASELFTDMSAADAVGYTWDADYLYMGIVDAEADYGNMATFMYFDTDPQAKSGTTDGYAWAENVNLPFYADYVLIWKNDAASPYMEMKSWDGSAWQTVFSEAGTNYNSGEVEFAVVDNADYREVKIARTLLGAPTEIAFASFTEQQWSDNYRYFGWPSDGWTDGNRAADQGFAHYWGFELSDGVTPNATANYDKWGELLPATATIPYSETFDADLGDMSTYSVSGTTKEWYQDAGAAYMNGFNSGDTEEDWLIFPAINLDNYSDEMLTFDSWYQYGSDDVDNYLKLMYSTDYAGTGDPSSATWNELTFAQPTSSETWTASGDVDLSSITGTSVYLAFKYHYTAGNYRKWGIDNVSVSEVIPPTQLAVTSVTPASPFVGATFDVIVESHDASGVAQNVDQDTEVQINLATGTGTISGTITGTISTGTNSATITGLSYDVAETIEVNASVNSGMSLTTSANQSITVQALPTATIPYSETFDADLGDMSTYSVSGATKEWYHDAGAAYMNGFNSGDTEEDWLIFPAINFDNYSDEVLTFDSWYKYGNDDVDNYLKLVYSTDYAGTGDPSSATWNELTFTQPASAETWTESGDIDLSSITGTSVYIAFKYHYNAGSYRNWGIDNISVLEVVPPTQLAITSVTPASPIAGSTFDVVVESHDASDIAQNVDQDTEVQLNLATGTGAFTGTVTGTISVGTSSVTLSGIAYDVAETIEVNASVNSGMSLTTSANESITVQPEPSDDLFFSEYIEGSSSNKALEIYNPTGADVDLALYVVKRASNGGGWGSGSELDITGTLTAGAVYVIANASAATEILDVADVTSDVCYFNGDDAVGLFKDGTLIDVIGDPDNDPGSGWDVAGSSAATGEHTLVRKEAVTYGNPTPLSSFGTSTSDSEWTVYDQNEFSYIGTHGPDVAAPEIVSATATNATTVEVDFSEDLDATTAENAANYSIDNGITVSAAALSATDNSMVTLTVSALTTNTYTLTVENVEDVNGNAITSAQTTFDYTEPVLPTQLAIASVTPASPFVGGAFEVVIESHDASGVAQDVDEDTEVQFNLASGTGAFTGTVTGTISVGTSSVTLSGISYDVAETIEVNASVNSGMSLTTSANESIVVQALLTATIPYSQTFDADLGDMSTYSVSGDTKEWYHNNGAAYMNGFNSGELEEDWLIFPAINFDNYSDEVLTFDSWYKYGNDDVDNYLKLMYSTDYAGTGDPSSATWNELTFTQPASAETWTESGDIDLSSITGTSVYIAFKYHYNAGNYRNWGIDNISISEVTPPTQLAIASVIPASPIVSTTFDVVVESQDDLGVAQDVDQDTEVQFNLASGTGAFTGTVTGTISVGTSSVTLSGISYDVAETIEVNASVNSGMSLTTSANQSIVIQGIPSATIPYFRDFETGDLNTDGWTTQVVIGTMDWELGDYSGDHFAEMSNFSGGNSASETWFISPAFDLTSAGNPVLSFWNACNYSGADIEVKVSADYDGISAPSTATWTDLAPTLSTGGFTDVFSDELSLDAFAGGMAYIAFKYTGTDSDGKTWQIDDISVSSDDIAPEFISGYPLADNIGGTSFDLAVQLNEPGTVYYLVYDDGATAPSVGDVMSANNTIDVAEANAEERVTVSSNINPNTAYDVYFVAEDLNVNPNVQSAVTLVDVQTANPDTDPPVFVTNYPAATGITHESFTAEVQLDEAGTAFFVVYDDGTTPPSVQDVIDNGTAIAVSAANTTFTADVSDLTAETAYDVYFVAQDDEATPNVQAATTLVELTTLEMPTAELFFSEYIEGSSNNKALEIYNPTGAEVDLTTYVVKRASNGGGWGSGSELDLTGTLADGEVYVIANPGAGSDILDEADVTSDVTYFNGNDALGLFKNDQLIDVFGDENSDVDFDVAGVTGAAAEHTIVRKPGIMIGNTDWAASAGTNATDSEWILYDQDEFSYLGWHGPDTFAPEIDGITATDATTVVVDFSEDLDQTTAETTANYSIDNSIGTPTAAVLGVGGDNSMVTLTLSTDLQGGVDYILTVDGVEDLYGNATANLQSDVFSYIPTSVEEGDIVINEIMYNTPGDDNEWIELYNNTTEAIDLEGFSLIDDNPSNDPIVLPAGLSIPAGGYFTIAIDVLTPPLPFTPDYDGSGFWNLNNGGDAITLFAPNASEIDYVAYLDEAPWPTEPDGQGPSLELISPTLDNSLAASWMASMDDGGTPGAENSVASTDPMLTITAPEDGAVVTVADVEVTFNVVNFEVAQTGADGYVNYQLDDEPVVIYYSTDPFTLNSLEDGEHTLTMWLVDNDGNPLDPAVEDAVTFTVQTQALQVATVAELRAGQQGGPVYELTGEALLTYQQGFRNKKYIQDATGGIEIDDEAGMITTAYEIGDGITGIKGSLADYYGTLQFVPVEDPGTASSTGNTLTPEAITLDELAANFEDYESELIMIDDASFTNPGIFATGVEYEITDGVTTGSYFKTMFYEADYIDEDVPTSQRDYIAGIAVWSYENPYITSRFFSDMPIYVGVSEVDFSAVMLYPNPVNEVLFIENTQNIETIMVTNMLGQRLEVLDVTTDKVEINTSDFDAGVYFITFVAENGQNITKKVIKR